MPRETRTNSFQNIQVDILKKPEFTRNRISRVLVFDEPVNRMGYWTSMGTLLLALAYDVAQLLSWWHVIAYPRELTWLFLPSLFLAPFFLVTMICLHFSAPGYLRIYTTISCAFALVYCCFATLTYFTQLGSVIPGIINGNIGESHVLYFKPRSFTMSIDCLGYFFMSLSTLFASFAFKKNHPRLSRWMRLNGWLILILVPAYFEPFLYYIASVWIITFSLSMIHAMKFFKRAQ